MLEISEKVVYQHRVCTVTGIREAYIDGRDYYELEALYERALKLFIPVEKAVPPDFRPVMTEREALSLIDSIKDIDDITPEEIESSATSAPFDRREESEYSRRLHYFSPDQIIRIMRFSYERSQARSARGRAATETDKRYLRLAQDLLCDELAVSLNLDREKNARVSSPSYREGHERRCLSPVFAGWGSFCSCEYSAFGCAGLRDDFGAIPQ